MKHYVFVCHANRQRSPTGQRVFEDMLLEKGYNVWNRNALFDADYEVISAGTYADENANEMREELGQQAEIVFAMSSPILEDLVTNFNVPRQKIVNLDIPDVYERDSPDLVEILREKLQQYIPQ